MDAFLKRVIAQRNREQGVVDGLTRDSSVLEVVEADQIRDAELERLNAKAKCSGCGGKGNDRGDGRLHEVCGACEKKAKAKFRAGTAEVAKLSRAHHLGRARIEAFEAWRVAFIADHGREPSVEERIAARAEIRDRTAAPAAGVGT